MIQRATTPRQAFNLHTDPTRLQACLITYKQRDQIVLEKHLEDLTVDGTRVFFRMTQEEANLFRPGMVEIQARIKLEDGTVPPTNKFRVPVDYVLNDEVI